MSCLILQCHVWWISEAVTWDWGLWYPLFLRSWGCPLLLLGVHHSSAGLTELLNRFYLLYWFIPVFNDLEFFSVLLYFFVMIWYTYWSFIFSQVFILVSHFSGAALAKKKKKTINLQLNLIVNNVRVSNPMYIWQHTDHQSYINYILKLPMNEKDFQAKCLLMSSVLFL